MKIKWEIGLSEKHRDCRLFIPALAQQNINFPSIEHSLSPPPDDDDIIADKFFHSIHTPFLHRAIEQSEK